MLLKRFSDSPKKRSEMTLYEKKLNSLTMLTVAVWSWDSPRSSEMSSSTCPWIIGSCWRKADLVNPGAKARRICVCVCACGLMFGSGLRAAPPTSSLSRSSFSMPYFAYFVEALMSCHALSSEKLSWPGATRTMGP